MLMLGPEFVSRGCVCLIRALLNKGFSLSTDPLFCCEFVKIATKSNNGRGFEKV